jgi:hypothetical protein
MYQVKRQGEKRLETTISGKLDPGQVKTVVDAILSESERTENGEILYDVAGFQIPSLDSIMIESS